MLSGFSLLVVEDDRDSREAIRETLEASGASVKTASSASKSLRRSGPMSKPGAVTEQG